MMAKHTPTPWHIKYNFIIFGKCGRSVASSRGPYDNVEDEDYMALNEANAEFIVRACNSHDQLLTACKAFVTAWEKSLQLEKTDTALRLARAAIAKATEGATT